MSETLDLDAIEQALEDAPARDFSVAYSWQVPALIAEVRALRAQVDAWHVHTGSHPATSGGCVTDAKGKCRYCGTEEPATVGHTVGHSPGPDSVGPDEPDAG